MKNPQNLSFPWGTQTPSNTPIPQPTPLTNPNSIQIQSAVLPQYTFRTDRQTDWPTDWPTHVIGDNSVRRVLTLYW